MRFLVRFSVITTPIQPTMKLSFVIQNSLDSLTPMRCSQQTLPRKLDLLQGFAILVATLACADGDALAELCLLLNIVPGARAVVWEVDTRKRPRAEIV